MKIPTTLFGLFLLLVPTAAIADLSLLVHETAVISRPISALGGLLTNAGHAAVELQNACLVDNNPTRLRPCGSSDPHRGVVIGQYVDVLPEQYQWVAIPTNYYLYGVPDKSQRPLIATNEISASIEDNGFELFFRDITALDRQTERGEIWRFRWRWKMLFGQSLKREIYKLTVATSEEEDLELITLLNESDNAGPNLTQWLNNNCSDFSRDILSQILEADIEKGKYPIKGLTTPKGVADTVLQTIMEDPDRGLRVEKIFQIPGNSQSLGVDNARALSARSLVLYEAAVGAFPLAMVALGAYWSASGADLHEQYTWNLDAPGLPASNQQLDEATDKAFGSRRLWNQRYRDFRAIMARQNQCHATAPLAPLRNRQGQVDNEGSLQLLGKGNNFIATDFAGMSARSNAQSFCLLAAHIKWQLEVRRDNKPLIRDFEPRWQLFLEWSERRQSMSQTQA